MSHDSKFVIRPLTSHKFTTKPLKPVPEVNNSTNRQIHTLKLSESDFETERLRDVVFIVVAESSERSEAKKMVVVIVVFVCGIDILPSQVGSQILKCSSSMLTIYVLYVAAYWLRTCCSDVTPSPYSLLRGASPFDTSTYDFRRKE